MVGSRMFDRGPSVDLLMIGKTALVITFECALVTREEHVRVMCVFHIEIKLTQGHTIGVT